MDANAELEITPAKSLDLGFPLMPTLGCTAYRRLLEIRKPKAGETIFTSAASGAVGQRVSQTAKLNGLRVIGNADL
ncbi:RNA elimination defective protein Red1, partial [Mortierella alpina]